MFKFLTALLGAFNGILAMFRQHHWKRQGRQETVKEMNDEINRQIEMGEAAITIDDPERADRLRSRFDRSRQ